MTTAQYLTLREAIVCRLEIGKYSQGKVFVRIDLFDTIVYIYSTPNVSIQLLALILTLDILWCIAASTLL